MHFTWQTELCNYPFTLQAQNLHIQSTHSKWHQTICEGREIGDHWACQSYSGQGLNRNIWSAGLLSHSEMGHWGAPSVIVESKTLGVLSVAFIWTQRGLMGLRLRGAGRKCDAKITPHKVINISILCTYLFKVCSFLSVSITVRSGKMTMQASVHLQTCCGEMQDQFIVKWVSWTWAMPFPL